MAQLKELTVSGMTTLVGGSVAQTMPASRNDDTIATTRFVKNAFANQDALRYVGTIDPIRDTFNGGTMTPNALTGETYKVSSSGYVNGVAVTVGALIICREDTQAAQNLSFKSNGSAAYDENQHYYMRFAKGSNRIIGRVEDTDYYYSEMVANKVACYVPENITLTETTSTNSCFYIKKVVNEAVVDQYIYYDSANFTDKRINEADEGIDMIPVYANLTSTNFNTFYNNLYIVDSSSGITAEQAYSRIALNWDFITSDMEGILYKSTSDFFDGHPLIADGTEGFVKTSNYILGPACERDVASGYNTNQAPESLVYYGILDFLENDIEENAVDLHNLESLIQTPKVPTYAWVYTQADVTGFTEETEMGNGQYYVIDPNTGEYKLAKGTFDSKTTYYERVGDESNTPILDPVQIPNFSFTADKGNTIEEHILHLYQMINGQANLQDTTKPLFTYAENDNSKFYFDDEATGVTDASGHPIVQTRSIADTVSKVNTLVGTDVTDVSNSGLLNIGTTSDGIKTTHLISNVVNLNNILGINKLAAPTAQNQGYQLSANSKINTWTSDNNKHNIISATEHVLEKTEILGWFTEGELHSSLEIAYGNNAHRILTQNADLQILNPNGNLLTSFNSTRALFNTPINLYDSTSLATWKIEVRTNGNLCIKK